MEKLSIDLVHFAGFILIALASKQIGNLFTKFNLPMISGFLFTGVIVGPYVFNFIPETSFESLRFIDEISLGIIAFSAGNELYIKELRDRMKSISWITIGLVIFTFPITAISILVLADYVPFMQNFQIEGQIAIALLGGSILVARSPSSAIAIVNELRAKGSFTKTVLGVTVIMDVVVIVLFGINASIADALLTNLPFNLGFISLLVFEIILSVGIGFLVNKIIQFLLSTSVHQTIKIFSVLILGYSVFLLSGFIREISHNYLPFEILIEPLLICMIAGFMISSFSNYRDDFSRILHKVGPPIYVLFFTLTGATLTLDILVQTWPIALALFVVRLFGIFLGSLSGGAIARDPKEYNRLGWMAYVTQAGVGLGLAKEVAAEFPLWGDSFATIIISVIVLNQIVGPPLFKYVIKRVGEAHPRGQTQAFDGTRDAIIFGIKAQSITLARQLRQHNWQVKLVYTDKKQIEGLDNTENNFILVDEINLETLTNLNAKQSEVIVCFLPKAQSYEIFSLAYENFGTETLIFHSKERSDFEDFYKLGVLVVEPQTAVATLLEHFVISPVGTSILLGQDDGQEIRDIEVRNPSMQGVTLRDLRLPLDVLILSIQREGQTIVSRGFSKFQFGDKVSMVGPREKLEEVMLRFDV
ncbi:MAG: cation:proton antiporter [Anaerolineaceae bacterium]|nr:cation:proton antiporter [Anaerolineaceae bacterium]